MDQNTNWSKEDFYQINIIHSFPFGQWNLKVLMLVDWKINMSMDEIRSTILHILFVRGMFHEDNPSYYVSNMH